VDLRELLATSGDRGGAIWTLEGSGDLNANLVRFDAGGGVEEHVNDEVDVIFVGISGSGAVKVDGERHALGPGRLVFVRKGTRRSTRAASGGLAYLTVHRRRGPLRIGGPGRS
jgi:quercetin dioxygenase-like cupin family protein